MTSRECDWNRKIIKAGISVNGNPYIQIDTGAVLWLDYDEHAEEFSDLLDSHERYIEEKNE